MKKNLRQRVKTNGFDQRETLENLDTNKVENVKKIYNQYAGKDEGELKQKLFEMAKQGKQDGSLDNKTIDSMAKRISPMLDGDKKQRLNSLVAMLKNNQY